MKKTTLFSLLMVSALLLLAAPLANDTTLTSKPIQIAEKAVTI
ncbi:hypothetical protein [Bacillus licheniformis]|nr:hypothetical protein [Bacillus licheniformis]MEC2292736.1 hypothetical protein [Bacillus licheniformis]